MKIKASALPFAYSTTDKTNNIFVEVDGDNNITSLGFYRNRQLAEGVDFSNGKPRHVKVEVVEEWENAEQKAENWVMDVFEHANNLMRCSFCEKNREQVDKLIAGEYPLSICNECVGSYDEILST